MARLDRGVRIGSDPECSLYPLLRASWQRCLTAVYVNGDPVNLVVITRAEALGFHVIETGGQVVILCRTGAMTIHT